VQQELIAEIQRNAIWPNVVTVDGNISNPYKTDFIGRDSSYINNRWEYQYFGGCNFRAIFKKS
jgi:hypothetical protein